MIWRSQACSRWCCCSCNFTCCLCSGWPFSRTGSYLAPADSRVSSKCEAASLCPVKGVSLDSASASTTGRTNVFLILETSDHLSLAYSRRTAAKCTHQSLLLFSSAVSSKPFAFVRVWLGVRCGAAWTLMISWSICCVLGTSSFSGLRRRVTSPFTWPNLLPFRATQPDGLHHCEAF